MDIFNKRGADWTRKEYEKVIFWLYKDRLKYLLLFAVRHLGARATPQDAEDEWQNFVVKKLDGVVKSYDPTRDGNCAFWSYLIACFKNYCYDQKDLIDRSPDQLRTSPEQLEGEPIE